MKHTHLQTAILSFALVTGTMAARAENSAYIDLAKVFQSYYRTGISEASLRKQEDIYKARAEEMAKEADAVRTRRDELQERALNVALSDEARSQSRQDAKAADDLYAEKQAELRKFMDSKQKELRNQYLEMRDNIVKDMLDQVKTFARKQGYDVVMDVSGLTKNFLPVIVCYPEDKDITDAAIAELNRGHEGEAPKVTDQADGGETAVPAGN